MINRINAIDWSQHYRSLNDNGYSLIPGLLEKEMCERFAKNYDNKQLYRNTINMERFRFGRGEYKYFNYPLPIEIQRLRESLYGPLSVIANEWTNRLAMKKIFPATHVEMIATCNAKNQSLPTPLLLKYEKGGFNTLHQDLYGEVYFPFQVIFVLSAVGLDFTGGEIVLVQQLPRAQSRAEVIMPRQGDALVITTNFRPVSGTRGYYQAKVKHGVCPVRSGTRYTLGIIFHDAA